MLSWIFKILGWNAMMNLSENIFQKNMALLGAAGIYFANKLLSQTPNQTNIFIGNSASFANNYLTFPLRLQLNNQTSSKSLKSKILRVSNFIYYVFGRVGFFFKIWSQTLQKRLRKIIHEYGHISDPFCINVEEQFIF